jgi:glycosyltransferase involved in cell wall biosynthesis
MAPAESIAAILRASRANRDIAIWACVPVATSSSRSARHGMALKPRPRGRRTGRRLLDNRHGEGLDVFAEAIRVLSNRGIKERVLVIGEGPARPWFEQQVPEAVFTGQLTGEDLARALASADVLLNPSTTEAFGNVTLEAMACGLPVVAAVATGSNNIVRGGETGFLVDAADADAFADALESYARDPELRHRHGEAGLAFGRRWTGTINAAAMRVYCAIVKGSGCHGCWAPGFYLIRSIF